MEVSSRADARGTTQQQVKIEVDHEHIFVLNNDKEKQQLEESAVRRSKLLTDLLESKPGRATLPVDASSLDGWRKYIQLQLTHKSSEGLSNVENKEMVMLVKVSEFLLDTETGQQTAKALADSLLVHAEAGSVENQVLRELHPDLQLKVVKASGCSLAHLQSRLVRDLQPLALESFVVDGDKLDLSGQLVSRGSPENPICRPPAGLSGMTYLKFLSLAHSDGASGDPERLSQALAQLVQLTHLDLRGNMLQVASCEQLGAALQCMPSLMHLDLSSNLIQAQGLTTLTTALSGLKAITHLSLGENSIVAGTAVLQTILASLPKLQHLALDHNAILRPVSAKSEESTDDPSAVYSTLFESLESLKLSNNCLDSNDIERLVSPLIDACVNLTALDLSDNSLSTQAVPAMCKIAAACTALQSLDISSCAFSCDEVAEILAAIPDQAQPASTTGDDQRQAGQLAPLLESLSLREMEPLSMEAEEEVDALPAALQRFSKLKQFDISALDLPAHAMEALPIASFSALTTLDVSMNSVLQQSPLGTQLSSLTNLQCLNVNSLFLPDDVLLSFSGALSTLTALSVLDMGNNAITSGVACSALAKALAALPSLQSLDMSDNDILDAESAFVAALPRMSNLRKLALEQNELHNDTVAPLSCAWSQLSQLDDLSIAAICAVSEAEGTSAAVQLCSTITSLTNLTSLCISSNSFQNENSAALADILMPLCKLSNLEMAYVDQHTTDLGFTAKVLAGMSSLTSLDLSTNRLGLEGAEALAPQLAKMTWLRDLDLSSSMLTPAGLHVIGESLKSLTALRALSLDDVVGPCCAMGAWSHVFAALASIAALRELELRHNRFPSVCVREFIAPHMSGLTALESLDIQDCGMSREGVKQMLLALKPLTALHSLNMGGNRIMDNVDKIVANHPLVEELDLPHAHLKDKEAHLLLESIRSMQMLRLVTLTDNYISDSVVSMLGEELPHVLVVFDEVAEMEEVVSIDADEGEDGEEGDEDDDEEDDEGDDESDDETDTEGDTYSDADSYSDSESQTRELFSEQE